jgi:hypothetical protein
MPTSKISRRTKENGSVYIYHVISSFRDKNKKPRCNEILIGKEGESRNFLIPNSNYFKVYGQNYNDIIIKNNKEFGFSTSFNSEIEFGHIYIFKSIAEQIGINKILKSVFPDLWREILIIAIYMVTDSTTMSGINDWIDEFSPHLVNRMTDQMCSCIFSQIKFSNKMEFFTQWIAKNPETEYIVYDVTSLSTYSGKRGKAERGYNRDRETLNQINFGMFYGKSTEFPIYFDDYEGSINDVSSLKSVLEQSAQLGLKKIDFVLDRGFISQTNLEYMKENKIPYIIPMPSNRLDYKKIIDLVSSNIEKNTNWLSDYSLYGVPVSYNLLGVDLTAHVFFNYQKRTDEIQISNKDIEKLEKELLSYKGKKGISRKFSQYFDILNEQHTNIEKIEYTKNDDKIKLKQKYLGYVVYLTSNSAYTPFDIISRYKTRDKIEKYFCYFKDDLCFNRLKVHNDNTAGGKLFIGFIGLILRTYFMNKLKNDIHTKNMTVEESIRRLRRFIYRYVNGKLMTQVPVSKSLRETFESLGLLVNDIVSKNDFDFHL